MIQTRPTNFTFSPDSAKAGTSYAFLGLSIVLATNGSVATQFDKSERVAQVTIFQPATTILNRQAPTVQDEFDALQRSWEIAEEVQPQSKQSAMTVRYEPKPFIWVDEPAELEDEILFGPEDLGHFAPTYGAPVKMTFLPPQEGRFVPVELDETDLEIFDI